ncbi:MAG: radical SAM protein [Thermodesulfobacteriota bacterium]
MSLAAARIDPQPQSPEHLRMSLAAAMTLGLAEGRFYRNARLGCINLLLTYPGGCKANCAFCGLAREKHTQAYEPRFEKFIRVTWRAWPLAQIIERCQDAPEWVQRVCVSMITHPRAQADTLEVCRRVHAKTGLPVSLLIAPTMLKEDDLAAMRAAGADRIGVAIDAATPEIFDALRGRPVGGPHRWDHYWRIYERAIAEFGPNRVGVHLIHGLGEREQELVAVMDRARSMGGSTHLFCFFPEKFSALAQTPQPPASGYRRIQMARWLIDHDQARAADMTFDQQGRVVDFGVSAATLEAAVASGQPFMTSGCPGKDGQVACNRPFGNEKPGPDLRNYPFALNAEDIALVREQLASY